MVNNIDKTTIDTYLNISQKYLSDLEQRSNDIKLKLISLTIDKFSGTGGLEQKNYKNKVNELKSELSSIDIEYNKINERIGIIKKHQENKEVGKLIFKIEKEIFSTCLI